MINLNSIKDIADKYENYIIDQWGVMHDGSIGYTNAIETIDYLKNVNIGAKKSKTIAPPIRISFNVSTNALPNDSPAFSILPKFFSSSCSSTIAPLFKKSKGGPLQFSKRSNKNY